jgi:hypothetical protein
MPRQLPSRTWWRRPAQDALHTADYVRLVAWRLGAMSSMQIDRFCFRTWASRWASLAATAEASAKPHGAECRLPRAPGRGWARSRRGIAGGIRLPGDSEDRQTAVGGPSAPGGGEGTRRRKVAHQALPARLCHGRTTAHRA